MKRIIHIHERMFVAHARFCPEFAQFQLVIGIKRQYVLLLVEQARMRFIVSKHAVCSLKIHAAVARIVSSHEFQSPVDIMLLRNRVHVIRLNRVLRRVGIVVLRLPAQVERFGNIEKIRIESRCFRRIRHIVEAVRQCEILAFATRKRVLVVHIHANRAISVFCRSVRTITVKLRLRKVVHRRFRYCPVVAFASVEISGESNQVQRVGFIASFEISILEFAFVVVAPLIHAQETIVVAGIVIIDALPAAVAAVPCRIAVRIVAGNREFADLRRSKKVTACTTVVGSGTQRDIIALHLHVGRDDVQNAANAFRIVFRSGLGDHLYRFNGACRQTFQHFFRVVAHQRIGFPIHVYFKIRRPVHRDVVLPVDRHHRHLAKHFESRFGFRIGVVFDIIRYFIYFSLYKRLLSHDIHLIELHSGTQQNSPEIENRHRIAHSKRTLKRVFSNARHRQFILPRSGQLFGKRSFFIAHEKRNRLVRATIGTVDSQRGIGFSFVCQRIGNNSFHKKIGGRSRYRKACQRQACRCGIQ